MRVLILGVSGLIGHKLFQELCSGIEIFGILHHKKSYYGNLNLFSGLNVIENVNVVDFGKLEGILFGINPDVIINCVGITKRKKEINNPVNAIKVNSLFPHLLANWAWTNKKRVIHFSTDCVFDGKKGNYRESSLTTAKDVYGKTKALGEITNKYSLTIRSSFIGQELFGKTELLEWFLAQSGKQIKGYTNTYYSGVSTIFMTKVVKSIIYDFPTLSGLYHLAPDHPISKYELLCIAKKAYRIDVDIVPDGKQIHFPTLNASKLKNALRLQVPSWNQMMEELANNKKYYTF